MTNSPDALAPTILIVSADPDALGALPYWLDGQGFRVRMAGSTDGALTTLAEGGIALVLTDIAMPRQGGFELCTFIKANEATRHLPVFMMTDAPDLNERQRCSECGASDYLPKPLDGAQLLAKIRHQLALSESLRAPQTGLNGNRALHALEVNYHALVAQSPDTVVLFDVDSWCILDANASAQILFGRDEAALLARDLDGLCAPNQPDGRPSRAVLGEYIERVLNGALQVFEASFEHASGRQIACELRLVQLPTAGRRLMHARIVDITRRTMAERLRSGQGEVLEMVARGAPLGETLDRLMLLIESQSEGVFCSVLLLDPDGVTIHPGAGPSLPPDYMAMLDGFAIGPAAGSCGTAMYRKETVIVSDIMHDPLWAPYRSLVEPHGLRACWSTPIFLDRTQVLGSFAMYYREVRSPGADDMRLIAVATHLAGIAIERTRREHELAQHRGHLEELVAARTLELTLAKQRAEQGNEELATILKNLSLAQEELVRRDKLAALGTLVAGVAHELNTPIGNCLMVATTMGERVQALAGNVPGGLRRSELDAYLEQAQQANELLLRNLTRAADLVASFKQIAVDHTSSQRRPFSLSQLLGELVPPLRVAARSEPVTVTLDAAPGLAMESYPGPLAQVVSNLFDNCMVHAFDGRHGGTIRIGACRRPSGMIALSIADDGVGIAPELLARVYDPFFTTRLGRGGSGLGLHVAHNIVTGILGGQIELSSQLGAGSCFTLVLPALAPA
ncbi:MAG: ATP-binding protein [Pseudomonadota bacterium]